MAFSMADIAGEKREPNHESRVTNHEWDEMVLVGRVARPHGIRGQVIVNPETDFVEERFAPGSILWARTPSAAADPDGRVVEEPLVVTAMRVQSGRPVIAFQGFERIEDVERLAGAELRVPEDALQPLGQGVFYHHQLVGCDVSTTTGAVVGRVARVEGGAAGSVLAIDGPRGEILIPLAVDICVEIDVGAKRIRIDPPVGLLEVNEKS